MIRGVKAGSDGLFADFHFNPKHTLSEQLLWDAEHAPENVGFSHNVEARTARRGDRVVVEAITRVQSVDLVADPATTRGLFESHPDEQAAPAAADGPALTLDDLKRDYPQLVEALAAEQAAELRRLEEELARLAGGGGAAPEARAGAATAPRVPFARSRFGRSPGRGRHQPAIHRVAVGGGRRARRCASWWKSGRGWSAPWAAMQSRRRPAAGRCRATSTLPTASRSATRRAFVDAIT